MQLRFLILALAASLLSGCLPGPEVSMQLPRLDLFSNAPEKVTVAGHSVVIAGPPGYCVDKSATRDSKSGAFVLLGSCASISNRTGAGAPRLPGVLTASVSASSRQVGNNSLDQLETFLKTDPGKGALARDSNPSSISILRMRRTQDALFVNLRDTSSISYDGLSQDYWRGLFNVSGHIVTVSVVGFKSSPMSSAQGLEVLRAFSTRIRSENPNPAAASSAG